MAKLCDAGGAGLAGARPEPCAAVSVGLVGTLAKPLNAVVGAGLAATGCEVRLLGSGIDLAAAAGSATSATSWD